jgi:hypothetical protein
VSDDRQPAPVTDGRPAQLRTRISLHLAAVAVGLLAASLVLTWQTLRVRYTYGGNWSALFCTGADYPVPEELQHEKLYLFPNRVGFDGQVYHYIAHDPIYPWRFQAWVDDPGLRYRRILVPLMAFVLAGGASDRIDVAYRAVVLAWIFLGAYWVARYAALCGRRAIWGLGFLLIPTALLSAERMTVDVALAALCAGVAVASRRGTRTALFLLLVAAGLARETGLLLVAAASIDALLRGKRREAALFGCAALPVLAWFGFVAAHTTAKPYPLSLWPFSGIVGAFLHPQGYLSGEAQWDWLSRHWQDLNQAADRLALLGVALAVVLAVRGLRTRRAGVISVAAALFSVQCALHNAPPDAWQEIDNFGRVYSPLLLAVGLDALAAGRWIGLVPPLLLWPRIGLALLGALRAVRHGLLG